MKDTKFLGICILISAIIVTMGLVYHAQQKSEIGRYQFQSSSPPGVIWTIDTVTGKVKVRGG